MLRSRHHGTGNHASQRATIAGGSTQHRHSTIDYVCFPEMLGMLELTQSQAPELLLDVVKRNFALRHSPLPGALVKAQMLSDAQGRAVFSEKHLGFAKFIDFVHTIPEIAIQGRVGSDVLLAPAEASELLAAFASPLPRLWRDFWRAFIEFPVPNTVRLYDSISDTILYEEAGTQRQGIPIESVSRDRQMEWRRVFSEEQPEPIRETLRGALQAPGSTAFNEFARRLRCQVSTSPAGVM